VVTADEGWRERAAEPRRESYPFRWSEARVLNEDAAQRLFPIEVPEGRDYYHAWRWSRDADDQWRASVRSAQAFLEGWTVYRNDWRCLDRHGVEHWQHQEVSVQPVGEGRWQVFGVTTDITEVKRAEAEQRTLLAELERSNSELEQFAYVASHDLQEPLRLVSAYTELLLQRYRDRLDKDADPLVGFITDGVSRMQRLVQDLLLYSRVSSRSAPMEPTPMAVPLALATENLTLAIAEQQAEVTHDDLPTVPCDSLQMTQLLQNLVGNAIKFRRPDEPPRVHISARPTDDGEAWRFEVRDNGIGIEPEYFERIFVIFQRLHTRRQYAGTGIGLAICKRIVERHGGRIGVESTPGDGALFWFTLPARPALSDNDEDKASDGSEVPCDPAG